MTDVEETVDVEEIIDGNEVEDVTPEQTVEETPDEDYVAPDEYVPQEPRMITNSEEVLKSRFSVSYAAYSEDYMEGKEADENLVEHWKEQAVEITAGHSLGEIKSSFRIHGDSRDQDIIDKKYSCEGSVITHDTDRKVIVYSIELRFDDGLPTEVEVGYDQPELDNIYQEQAGDETPTEEAGETVTDENSDSSNDVVENDAEPEAAESETGDNN